MVSGTLATRLCYPFLLNFFHAIDHEIHAVWLEDGADLTENIALHVIESILGPGEATQCFLSVAARALAFETGNKTRFFFMVVDTPCGKGTLTEIFNSVFSEITDYTDAGCLIKGSCKGTGLDDMEFLVPL